MGWRVRLLAGVVVVVLTTGIAGAFIVDGGDPGTTVAAGAPAPGPAPSLPSLPTLTTVPPPTLPATVTVPTLPRITVPRPVVTLPPLRHCRSDRTADRHGLWVADVDAGTLCLLVADKTIGGASFSPDGRRIAFTAQDGVNAHGSVPGRMYVMNVDGSGLRQLEEGATTPRQPSWSPDGRFLAYTRWPVDSAGDAAVVLLDWSSGASREIGRIDQGSTKLEWSPDGRTIAATELNRRGVLTIDVGSGASTRVPFEGAMPYMCSWSPDGQHLVVSGERGPVVVTDRTGGSPRTLVADGRFARWSPAGNQISVWRDFSSWLVAPDGTGLREVQNGASPIGWSGDGRFLATLRGARDVDVVDVGSGSVTSVVRGSNEFGTSAAGWTRSGHLLTLVVEPTVHYRY